MVDGGSERRPVQRRGAAASVALAVLLAAAAAPAERVELEQRPRIVNGIETHDYPTTGALLYSQAGPITPDNAGAWCTGTLIGCETFLVAAHCVDDPVASHYLVYLQNVGLVPVASITRHPNFTDDNFPSFDAAVVKLASWVTGIAPTPINQIDPAPFIGVSGTIVGFGQTFGGADNYGLKRAGTVETSACPPDLQDNDVLCWEFTAPLGPPGTDSNTCNGDSGGPLFLDLGGGPVVAGITSGGDSLDCLPSDVGYDADVFVHRNYILGELGSDSTMTCGGLPPVGDAQTTVVGHAGTLDVVAQSASHSFVVPSGANALRIAMNGEDDGFSDVDLFVKQGPGASSSNFDCAVEGNAVFGGCTINLPAAGTWSAAVERISGAGRYQLTATVFGGSAPVCGNNVREFNEACDGSDDDVCPGACDGDCACPAECTIGDLTEVKARINASKLRVRGRLQNQGGAFTGADPRDGFSLTLTQGANTVTLDIPPDDPGWIGSNPERRRFKWIGDINGVTRVKAIDRTAKKGIWKIVVVGQNVPGSAGMDVSLPVQSTLTIDGVCTKTTF